MEIYDVSLSDDARLAKPRRLLVFAICVITYVAVSFALDWLLPNRGAVLLWHGKYWEIEAGMALMMVIPMSLYFSSKKFSLVVTQPWQAYQIVIDEEEIKTRRFNSWNWALSKSIQRGGIKTVIEKEKGLLVSSHNRVGTFLWGGVWIPKQLTDYEHLRRLILSWKTQ